jgi:hypothetical protein
MQRRQLRASNANFFTAPFCDEKVANRDTKVWHLMIENGY